MSQRTLNVLKKLSYQELKNLDHETLQKYKRRLNIIDQEGNAFTDKDLIRMMRKFISGKKYSTGRKNIKRKTKKSRGGSGNRYGIKNNKVIEIYPHKIEKKIGRHNYYILWKTTKENLPGKTFHGKFYKSKEEALQNIKRKTKKSRGGSRKRTVKKFKKK